MANATMAFANLSSSTHVGSRHRSIGNCFGIANTSPITMAYMHRGSRTLPLIQPTADYVVNKTKGAIDRSAVPHESVLGVCVCVSGIRQEWGCSAQASLAEAGLCATSDKP